MVLVSEKYNRTVNNITMAMPHAGVMSAVRNPINQILQPEDLNGLGEYDIVASVPSPAINVLCASATADELAPIIYSSWNNGTNAGELDILSWPLYHDLPDKYHCNASLGNDLDALFNFGRGPGLLLPPTFPKLPITYNTVSNATSDLYTPAAYLLGTSPLAEPPYMLCSLQSMLYPNCSTRYHGSLGGSRLFAH